MISNNERKVKIQSANSTSRITPKALIGAALAFIVIIAATIAAIKGHNSSGNPEQMVAQSPSSNPSGQVKLPKGAKGPHSPIVATNGGTLKEEIPTLQIFEDFQCPMCRQTESSFGSKIREMGESGKINVAYYILTFLDKKAGNEASMTAAGALGCAADVGKFTSYHDKLMANKPGEDGHIFGGDQIQKAAMEVGISEPLLDEWKTCVSKKTYNPYFKSINSHALGPMGLTGTPAFYLDGTILKVSPKMSPSEFEELISSAKK